MIKKLLLLFSLIWLSALFLPAQQLYFFAPPANNSDNSHIGIIDLQTCDTTIIVRSSLNALAFHADSTLYGVRKDTIYKVSLEDGSINYVADFGLAGQYPTDNIATYGIAAMGNTIFVLFGQPAYNLGKYNVATGATILVDPTFSGLNAPGGAAGLSVRNGQLISSNWGGGFYALDTTSLANNELLYPHPDFEPFSNAIATLPVNCDSSRTFITNLWYLDTPEEEDIMEVNFATQSLELVCSHDFLISSLWTYEESLPPPCALSLDPDQDDSTAPLYTYRADSSCAGAPISLVDDDLSLLSEIGFIDSIRIVLSGAPDGPLEFLSIGLVDSLNAVGSGTHSLLLRPAEGAPSLERWRGALSALEYHNTAAPLPTFGQRQATLLAYAAGNAADTALALIPIFNTTPPAGEDGSLALCPQDSSFGLFAALQGAPSPGGAWQPGNGLFNPAVDAPGDYLYITSGNGGCPSDTAAVRASLLPEPSFSLGPDTVLCQAESFLLQAPAGLGDLRWSDGSNGPSLTAATSGTYWLQAANAEGCAASDTIALSFSHFDSLLLSASPVTCFGGSDGAVSASPAGGQPPYAFEWAGGAFAPPLPGLPAGAYAVTATDAYGCTQAASIIVPEPAEIRIEESRQLCQGQEYSWQGYSLTADTSLCAVYPSAEGCDSTLCLALSFLPAPSIGLPDTASFCEGQSLTLSAGQHAAYLWQGGSTSPTLEVSQPGDYSVTVTETNGCTAADTASVSLRPAPGLWAQAIPPLCFGQAGGAIIVDSVTNGQAPFVYQLEGQSPQAGPVFNQLSAGAYRLLLTDAAGCRADTLLPLPEPSPFFVDAGEDQTLTPGDSVQLSPVTGAALPAFAWSPPAGLSCADCPNPVASPLASQLYRLTVTDSMGCMASDEVLVALAPRPKVAVPNAFSPNGDGANDRLLPVSGAENIRVAYFRVFNRWGAMVHGEEGALVAELAGWDGTYKEEPQPIGVYVYALSLEWPDGRREVLGGDVALLR
ncbi:MAG: gliding motility-associated C-terminal domain-containing protein [Lewinellaceae bacterium]|nr:gliding motility-associated C-terminal domain-containing protein [Phaeodactylibacter sp.]MCB9038788.1 gliding motility-associated C-terminal domain-containing protein [Lewinellaceae bacterium]